MVFEASTCQCFHQHVLSLFTVTVCQSVCLSFRLSQVNHTIHVPVGCLRRHSDDSKNAPARCLRATIPPYCVRARRNVVWQIRADPSAPIATGLVDDARCRTRHPADRDAARTSPFFTGVASARSPGALPPPRHASRETVFMLAKSRGHPMLVAVYAATTRGAEPRLGCGNLAGKVTSSWRDRATDRRSVHHAHPPLRCLSCSGLPSLMCVGRMPPLATMLKDVAIRRIAGARASSIKAAAASRPIGSMKSCHASPLLYKYVHKQHHDFKATTIWASEYFCLISTFC